MKLNKMRTVIGEPVPQSLFVGAYAIRPYIFRGLRIKPAMTVFKRTILNS